MHGGYPSDNENMAESKDAPLKTQAIYHKNKESLKNIVFKKEPKVESNLLNEDQIKDLGI
jgi:hypothetical protein